MNRKSTLLLEIGLLAVVGWVYSRYFDADIALLRELLVGSMASLTLLIVFEVRELMNERFKFGSLQGVYKRLAIYNENKNTQIDSKWTKRSDFEGVDPWIVLKYVGGSAYSVRASYDGNQPVRAFVVANKENSRQLTGHYQYVHRTGEQTDIGDYRIQVDERTKGQLFCFHQNLVPSGASVGYEIWQKDHSGTKVDLINED